MLTFDTLQDALDAGYIQFSTREQFIEYCTLITNVLIGEEFVALIPPQTVPLTGGS
jgi:hypothetical protein